MAAAAEAGAARAGRQAGLAESAGPWDLQDLVQEYYAEGALRRIAGTVDSVPIDSPVATGAQRFIVQSADTDPRGLATEAAAAAAAARGLIIDIHAVRRSATGCPILQGFFGHNDTSDPAFTVAIGKFMATECGPGIEYGSEGYEVQAAEFDELRSCLAAGTVTGEQAAKRRKVAEGLDWGYVYPPAFAPFEIEGCLPAAGLVGKGKRKAGGSDLAERGLPSHKEGWRLRRAVTAARQKKVISRAFTPAPELFRRAVVIQGSDPDEAFTLAFEASMIDSPIGEDNPWLLFIDEAERERCEDLHMGVLNACVDGPDIDTAMQKYLDIQDRVYKKIGLNDEKIGSGSSDSESEVALSNEEERSLQDSLAGMATAAAAASGPPVASAASVTTALAPAPALASGAAAGDRGPSDFPPGTRVRIIGLVNAAQHNGKVGRVSKKQGKEGRVGVQLGAKQTLAVR